MRLLGILLLTVPLFGQENGPARADWSHYGGTQSSWRYGALDQITSKLFHSEKEWTPPRLDSDTSLPRGL